MKAILDQKQNCDTCLMLCTGIYDLLGSNPIFDRENVSVSIVKKVTSEGPLRINVFLLFTMKKLQLYTSPGMSFFILLPKCWNAWVAKRRPDKPSLLWPDIGSTQHICEDSSSTVAIDLARRLIEKCTNGAGDHPQCGPQELSILPTRVIDVGTADVEPHLFVSGNKQARYAALSHCWGGKSPLTMRTSTMEEFRELIPMSKLPRTFQDAVTVTRALGIQYLWIDSLCIIQDSIDDWLQESAKMASLYENSTVTIAADAAVDSTSGFLTHVNRKQNLIEVSYGDTDGQQKSIYFREKGMRRGQNPYHGWHNYSHPNRLRTQIDGGYSVRSKLCTRGWTFQELILSPRTLRFAEEMAWECRSLMACECSANSVRLKEGMSLMKKKLVDCDWKALVEEYSHLELTVPSDRLPALAGLAEVLARSKPDRYFCGLWEKDLPQQLAWRVKEPWDGTRFDEYIAPSWSWASVRGQVYFDKAYNSPIYQILSVECEYPRPGAVFGTVTKARLTVYGLLAQVVVRDYSGVVQSPQQAYNGSYCVSDFCRDTSKTKDPTHTARDTEKLWFLILAGGPESTSGEVDKDGKTQLDVKPPRGLLLRQCVDHKCFERVGLVIDGDSEGTGGSWSDSDDAVPTVPSSSSSKYSTWEEWVSISKRREVVIV